MVEPRRREPLPPPKRPLQRAVITFILVGVMAVLFWRAPNFLKHNETESAPVDSSDADAAPPRCTPQGKPDGVLVGVRGESADDDALVPFAAEVGRGVSLGANGFAVGVKHQLDGAMHAAVAVVGANAQQLKLYTIDKSRGDLDAPMVVLDGDGWVAATLEPNAGGMSLRLVRWRDDTWQWGAEIEQGRDESLAYDILFGKEVGVVVWDDVTPKRERGVIMLATVAVDSLEGGEDATAVSTAGLDAELPRLVPRPNGFWLAYIARARTVEEADAGPEREDDDGRFRAERIQPSWIELMPLDARGHPDGSANAVTSKDGYAVAFDMEPAADGGVLLTWRDDDTPSGAQGGKITSQLVSASGTGQEQPIVEDDIGAGVPTLLPGWVAIPTAEGEMLLGPMATDGQLRATLRAEPLLAGGELIAAEANVLLVARNLGKALRLSLVTCDASDSDGGAP